MNDNRNGQSPWWRPLAMALGAILAGALGWVTGVKSDIDAHTRDIQKLQIETREQSRQLERVEGKIDRVLETLRRP